MKKIRIGDMTVNGMTVKVDAQQLDKLMVKTHDDIAQAMRRGISKAMSQVKSKQRDKLYSSITPQAKKVGHSLDFEYDVQKGSNDVNATARFGSKGPDAHGSLDYVGRDGIGGARTSPDDDGGTYPIAAALEDGNPKGPHWFKWNSEGAAKHGRQYGAKGGNTGWMPVRDGKSWTFGFPAHHYIKEGIEDFRARIGGYVQRELDRRI